MSPGGTVALELEFTGADSHLAGTFHSAAQSMMGAMAGSEPMSNVVRSGNSVTFTTASVASFAGEISADGTRISTRSIDPSATIVFVRMATAVATPAFQDAPLTEASLAHLQQVRDERAAPEITYASEDEALAAAEEREQAAAERTNDGGTETSYPATKIDAVMDLQELRVQDQVESRGDEYYLVVYKLRGLRGTGDRIYRFDYQKQVWPIASGDNWATAGKTFTIPQGAGRLTFNNVEPFEVYGFVAVLMDANGNTEAELNAAFGFGEFSNEAGVTEVVADAFDRAVPRTGTSPDYSDLTCSNIRSVSAANVEGLKNHFDFIGMWQEGLAKAIQDAIREPLKRANPDRYDGAIWAFDMNTPGGAACSAFREKRGDGLDRDVFPIPNGEPLEMSTFNNVIKVQHTR